MPTNFTVITPTGDRPGPLTICYAMMAKQTIKPAQWIIIDDGLGESLKLPPDANIEFIKRERKPGEPDHTLPLQLQKAISRVKTNKVIIIEDDDWYDKEYLEKTSNLLDQYDLVGLTHNTYYFVKDKEWFTHCNVVHSSLCSTGFAKKAFPFFNQVRLDWPFVDLDLWRKGRRQLQLKHHLYRSEKIMVLGIKQLPGRIGVTYDSNRRQLKNGMRKDNDLSFFKSVVGNDFNLYTPYFE